MRLSNRIKIPVAALFVACEIALYITFMAGSLDYDTDIAVKYSSVCICAFFALLCCYSLEPTDFLLLGAMVFTIVSDWFLLVTGENIVVGLSTFIVAQLLHFVRISIIRRKVPIVSIILRVVIPVVAIVVMAFMDDLLCAETVLVAIYFSQLVMNFADSIVLCKKSRLYILLCVGMFLFICCDINVGLYNLSAVTDVKLSSSVINFAEYAMWAFYLPSQVCIVLTGVGSVKTENGGTKKISDDPLS